MTTELAASVRLQEGMHFVGSVPAGHEIDLDSTLNLGPSPMENVLLSLAGCSAMDVIAILRKQRQPVEGLEVHIRGQRRDEHPTVFTEIQIEYVVHGENVATAAVERAIELSRDRYCPVWAMLGQSVTITPRFRVVSSEYALTPID
jgi:putative redox protein